MKLLLTILTMGVLVGCGKYAHDFELDERSFGPDLIKEIERESRIKLPPGSHGLNYFYKAPIDPGFAAKIEFPLQSRDEMLKQISMIKQADIRVTDALGPSLSLVGSCTGQCPVGSSVICGRQLSACDPRR